MNLRPCVLAFVAFSALSLWSAFAASTVHGGLVVTMTGTIEDGTLNGISLNGQGFTVRADLVDGVDLAASTPTIGYFQASQIAMEFSSGAIFSFNVAQPTYFVQATLPASSAVQGFSVGIQLTRSQADSAVFGYRNPDFFAYDPNAVMPFSYSSFTESIVTAGVAGLPPATFNNGNKSLVINSLGLANASFVSAVPEPSSLSMTASASVCVLLGRRKRRPS